MTLSESSRRVCPGPAHAVCCNRYALGYGLAATVLACECVCVLDGSDAARMGWWFASKVPLAATTGMRVRPPKHLQADAVLCCLSGQEGGRVCCVNAARTSVSGHVDGSDDDGGKDGSETDANDDDGRGGWAPCYANGS